MTGALVAAPVVSAFKECLKEREVLRTIDDLFEDLGYSFDPAAEETESASGHGARRSRAAGYLASVDLSDTGQADRLLGAIGFKLAQWERTAEPRFRQDLDRLIQALNFGGFTWDGKRIARGRGSSTAGLEVAAPLSHDDELRVWDPSLFRLFLSHVSAHKVAVADLKRELLRYGVSGFLAHEDIAPSLEWQAEIMVALRSMDAMAALLTPDFHESKWTDQEVGAAVGRGILVIPVRLPVTPYGFIAKNQALRGNFSDPSALASALVDILLKRRETAEAMREGLVIALESSPSFAAAKAVTGKIEAAGRFTAKQRARLETAIATNRQVGEATGVPTRLRRVVAASAETA